MRQLESGEFVSMLTLFKYLYTISSMRNRWNISSSPKAAKLDLLMKNKLLKIINLV